MHIDALTLTDFRNFEEAKLLPGRQINLIVGDNGSGKTSLLESIYCLGSGRSFRPGTHKQIIRHEQSSFTIFARGTDEQGDQHALGFQRDREGLVKIRVDGELVRRFGQMAQLVPVQLMTPETVELVLGGPRVRRQFLDWGVFHVEHRYIGEITSFNHVLKQRNSLLKQRRVGQEGDYWDAKFAELGEQVAAERQKYWSGFEPVLLDRLKHFLPEYDFKIILKQGWDGDLSLRDAMAKNKSAEDRYGHAIVGPHKAELKMLANGEDVKSILSRGQLKLFVAAIKVVQGEYLFAKTGVQCIYLVDDITAELDAGSQQKFCEALVATKAQLFVSAINKGELPEIIRSADTRMFHVEHGTVKEL
ncbi:DNA replication/repair protein RecF [Pseudidiomarina sp. 1APR75-33.1]|uniref:DNA replication/repair protein RecF n=1 Tax=Pseudidiomarina terrestris TaxID=2820060 RepID=UPI002651DBD5|nr:DNA replication/repair protein RecF [Pseudidiomarina sp. 1APR75-33.1]MDN7127993.1 DNA replication/repair protein RecF [Pseudidiomarina sp. 1APR75-33.1]